MFEMYNMVGMEIILGLDRYKFDRFIVIRNSLQCFLLSSTKL